MKTTILFLATALALFSCSSNTEKTTNTKDTTTLAASVKEEPKSNWTYSEDEDKMTNAKRYFAQTISTNKVEFKFPYDGGSNFSIMVRNMDNKNEVLLGVSKGQFITSFGSSNSLQVKFDDGKPMNFTYNGTSDGSNNIIFLDNAAKFISKLKTAKKVLIGVEFFQEGTQYMEFDVAGLKWEK